MKKKLKESCELCDMPASTYCESDRARLCWECDTKVHKANFLVTKHTRILLCHICHNPTPWSASGPTLPPSFSFCLSCHASNSSNDDDDADHEEEEEVDSSHDDDDDDDDEEEEEDNDDDDGDNQVVPLTSNSSSVPSLAEYNNDYDDDDDDEEEEDNDDYDGDNQVVPLTSNSSSVPSLAEYNNDYDDDDDDGELNVSMLPSSSKRKREFYMVS